MQFTESFKAYGHKNVTLNHKTTIMITTDKDITFRGDCIALVSSEKGLSDLKPELREAAQNVDANITLKIKIRDQSFEVHGYGHPNLTWKDPIDMVARRSNYTCSRTLMIKADLASVDVPRDFVERLREDLHQVNVTITAKL